MMFSKNFYCMKSSLFELLLLRLNERLWSLVIVGGGLIT